MSQPVTPPNPEISRTVGMIILTTTVSSVVWWQITLWLWAWCAREGWWGQPGDGAKIIAAGIALFVTWILWGRVTYWLTMPDSSHADPT